MISAERGVTMGRVSTFRVVGFPAPFIGGMLYDHFGFWAPVTGGLLGVLITIITIVLTMHRSKPSTRLSLKDKNLGLPLGDNLKKNDSITTPDEAVKCLANLKGWRPEDVRVEETVLLDLSFRRGLTAPLKDATNAKAVKKSIFGNHRLFRGRLARSRLLFFQPKAIGGADVDFDKGPLPRRF